MSLSTIRPDNSGPKNYIFYVLAIVGALSTLFFGYQLFQNWNLVKGKAALTVQSPYGPADVYINNEKAGSTPFESKSITPGENTISIINENRIFESTKYFLEGDKTTQHFINIFMDLGVSDFFSSGQEFWFSKEKSDIKLRVISNPNGARVIVDNNEMGTTPYSASNITPGDYDIKVEFPGYEAYQTRIKVTKDLILNIDLKMFPKPVPISISKLEGSDDLYDLSLGDEQIVSDPQTWASALVHWNTTRGIDLMGTGLNKDKVFDYLLDYKGNFYDKNGQLLSKTEDIGSMIKSKRGGYLGRLSDGAGLTTEARAAFENFTGTTTTTETVAEIKSTPTGWLRVRSQPTTASTEVTKLDVGTSYPVLEESEGWVKIEIDENTEGWVSGTYVEIKEITTEE
jgi:hypothetical protein